MGYGVHRKCGQRGREDYNVLCYRARDERTLNLEGRKESEGL